MFLAAWPLKSTSAGVAPVLGPVGPRKTPIRAPAGPVMLLIPKARTVLFWLPPFPSGPVCGVLPEVPTKPVALIWSTCPGEPGVGYNTGEFRGLESFETVAPATEPANAMSATEDTFGNSKGAGPATALTVAANDPVLSALLP